MIFRIPLYSLAMMLAVFPMQVWKRFVQPWEDDQ